MNGQIVYIPYRITPYLYSFSVPYENVRNMRLIPQQSFHDLVNWQEVLLSGTVLPQLDLVDSGKSLPGRDSKVRPFFGKFAFTFKETGCGLRCSIGKSTVGKAIQEAYGYPNLSPLTGPVKLDDLKLLYDGLPEYDPLGSCPSYLEIAF